MKNCVIIGGTSGIGLAIAQHIQQEDYDNIYVYGLSKPNLSLLRCEKPKNRIKYKFLNLNDCDFSFLNNVSFSTLIFTAGFGRVALLEDVDLIETKKTITVNMVAPILILRKIYKKLASKKPFYCMFFSSISGKLVSPYLSVYGAAKSGLSSFIESLNIELEALGYDNRVLDVVPGFIPGTSFYGSDTDLNSLSKLAQKCLDKMYKRDTSFFPDEETYLPIIEKYRHDNHSFGLESYNYKLRSGRINKNKKYIIGYLSGTFDLFHVGHLKLLQRAKQKCDYLIVGVHRSGSWKGKETFIPFEERLSIIQGIRYVDFAVESCTEDSDAWSVFHYDKLFVGSDYKNSDRFKKYEKFFSDKNVEIIYFPYTKTTSSSILRERIKKEL